MPRREAFHIPSTKFEKDLLKGRLGEMVLQEHIRVGDEYIDIADVRDDFRYRECDIDFLVESRDKQWHRIEVKTDWQAHRTGNLVFETKTSGKIGCLEKTKADIIFYFVAESGTGYWIGAQLLKRYAHSGEFELVKMGDRAEGYLIPLANIVSKKIGRKIM